MLPLKDICKIVGTFTKKNAPTILSIAAGLGVFGTGYLAFKAGEDTAYDIADVYEQTGEDPDKKTKAKIVVKRCVPAVGMGVVTIAMIASSNIISIRRAKAMAASYAILAESADIYRRKVIERVGEHKEDEIRGAIAKERFDNFDSDEFKSQAVDTGHGVYWCIDEATKQPFLSSSEWILSQKSRADRYVVEGEDFISLGEWCSMLGIREPMSPLCDLGWPASVGIPLVVPIPTCTQNNGEPGYDLQYTMEPMSREDAEIYNANHYISSAEGYY